MQRSPATITPLSGPCIDLRGHAHRCDVFLEGGFSILALAQVAGLANLMANESTINRGAAAAFEPTYSVYVAVLRRLEALRLGLCAQV